VVLPGAGFEVMEVGTSCPCVKNQQGSMFGRAIQDKEGIQGHQNAIWLEVPARRFTSVPAPGKAARHPATKSKNPD